MAHDPGVVASTAAPSARLSLIGRREERPQAEHDERRGERDQGERDRDDLRLPARACAPSARSALQRASDQSGREPAAALARRSGGSGRRGRARRGSLHRLRSGRPRGSARPGAARAGPTPASAAASRTASQHRVGVRPAHQDVILAARRASTPRAPQRRPTNAAASPETRTRTSRSLGPCVVGRSRATPPPCPRAARRRRRTCGPRPRARATTS